MRPPDVYREIEWPLWGGKSRGASDSCWLEGAARAVRLD
jgi:hypothetical protein